MAVADQRVTEKYAIYNGDSCEVLPTLPDDSVHLSIYSPPFATDAGGLYHYSSSERDLSNSDSYALFFEHYSFIVQELFRLTPPGRVTAVHCADIPTGNTGRDHLRDFSGDIIRLHEKLGWFYAARYAIWKDPFEVYIRTLAKNLRHRSMTEDSSRCTCAAADFLLVFRKPGENKVPIAHPSGLMEYAGARKIPADRLKYKGWAGKQTENKYSQWIWRQYASAFWDDVRSENVLPFRDCKEPDDERHVHPLQLDIIERAVILWSNPGETVLTPFMGVGSEVYGAVKNGRRGIGVELKASYYRQSLKNVAVAVSGEPIPVQAQVPMFGELDGEDAPAPLPAVNEEDPGERPNTMAKGKKRRADGSGV
jgi:DNA modification methylase